MLKRTVWSVKANAPVTTSADKKTLPVPDWQPLRDSICRGGTGLESAPEGVTTCKLEQLILAVVAPRLVPTSNMS